MTPKWPKYDSNMTKKLTQKMTPIWRKNDAKMTQKWRKNDANMTKKWPEKWLQYDAKMTLIRPKNDANMTSEMTPKWREYALGRPAWGALPGAPSPGQWKRGVLSDWKGKRERETRGGEGGNRTSVDDRSLTWRINALKHKKDRPIQPEMKDFRPSLDPTGRVAATSPRKTAAPSQKGLH